MTDTRPDLQKLQAERSASDRASTLLERTHERLDNARLRAGGTERGPALLRCIERIEACSARLRDRRELVTRPQVQQREIAIALLAEEYERARARRRADEARARVPASVLDDGARLVPPPRDGVSRVYYIRAAERGDAPIKIGSALDVGARLGDLQIGNHELLVLVGFEIGGRDLELERHAQFEAWRRPGEWFEPNPDLHAHIVRLREAMWNEMRRRMVG